MEDVWGRLGGVPAPKTLAVQEQVRQVAYDGPPVPCRGAVLVGMTEFDSPEVENLPWGYRDVQLLAERFRALACDHVTVLTSAQKEKKRKPRTENIVAAIQAMRERVGAQGVVLVFISTHGIIVEQNLLLLATDFNPQTYEGMLSLEALHGMISPTGAHRGCLVVDYSSHHRQTLRSFPNEPTEFNLPPPREGLCLMCSPPQLPSSFTVKFASMLDELLARQLPICGNSIYAIFCKHAEAWFGLPKKVMVLVRDRAPTADSGKLRLFDWDRVQGLDTSAVEYVLKVSQPVPAHPEAPLPTPPAMCADLLRSVPSLRVKEMPPGDEVNRMFVLKVAGGPPSRGPRGDKVHYSREVQAICEERGLPHVEVIKAWFGKLNCVTSAVHFEAVCRAFQQMRTLQSRATVEAAPLIEYVGVLVPVEVATPFATHAALDELSRRVPPERDPRSGCVVEEVGQIDPPTTAEIPGSAAWAGTQSGIIHNPPSAGIGGVGPASAVQTPSSAGHAGAPAVDDASRHSSLHNIPSAMRGQPPPSLPQSSALAPQRPQTPPAATLQQPASLPSQPQRSFPAPASSIDDYHPVDAVAAGAPSPHPSLGAPPAPVTPNAYQSLPSQGAGAMAMRGGIGSTVNTPKMMAAAAPTSPHLSAVQVSAVGGVPEDVFRAEITRLNAALESERRERENAVDRLAQQVEQLAQQQQQQGTTLARQQTQMTNIANTPPTTPVFPAGWGDVDPAALKREVARLAKQQQQLMEHYIHPPASPPKGSPTRGGAVIHVGNDEWMEYQDQLKLFEVQLKNIHAGMAGIAPLAPLPAPVRPPSEGPGAKRTLSYHGGAQPQASSTVASARWAASDVDVAANGEEQAAPEPVVCELENRMDMLEREQTLHDQMLKRCEASVAELRQVQHDMQAREAAAAAAPPASKPLAVTPVHSQHDLTVHSVASADAAVDYHVAQAAAASGVASVTSALPSHAQPTAAWQAQPPSQQGQSAAMPSSLPHAAVIAQSLTPTRNTAGGGLHVPTPPQQPAAAAVSVEEVRALRLRVERIERMGDANSLAQAQAQAQLNAASPSPITRQQQQHLLDIDFRLDQIQGHVAKLSHVVDAVASKQDGREREDAEALAVRRAYNDMMLEDIDMQLQGRAGVGVGIPAAPQEVQLPSGLRAAIHTTVRQMVATVREQMEAWTTGQIAGSQEDMRVLKDKVAVIEQVAVQVAADTKGFDLGLVNKQDRQLIANTAAIGGLEQSIQSLQSTLVAHASRLQGTEERADALAAEMHAGQAEVRGRVDSTIQRIGQAIMELDQKVMKDVTEATARVTVGEQRINHLDMRLGEDAERLHRIETRVEQCTRVLQERIDEQGQNLIESERRVLSAYDDKLGVMKQIADLAEKSSAELDKKWHDNEHHLKTQLRAALQQHIEGLEQVLQDMKADIKGVDDRTAAMEHVVGDAKTGSGLLDQKVQMMEKTLDALRNGFETYVHDGTVHIMQAQNDKMDELRQKLGMELDSFDIRIRGIETQRVAADEELASALEKIQIAVAHQPSSDKVDRALAAMEEHRIRPAMEAASKGFELAREMQGVMQRVDMMADAQRERGMEVNMLKEQVAGLREKVAAGGAAPAPVPTVVAAAPTGAAPEVVQQLSDLQRRVDDGERKFATNERVDGVARDVSVLQQEINNIKVQMTNIQQSAAAAAAGAAAPVPAPLPAGDSVNTAELMTTIENVRADVAALRSKVSSMGSGDTDDLVAADISKLKKDVSDLKKEVEKLKGWKQGKESESALLEKTATGVRELKKSVDDIKFQVDDLKER